jgi:DNA polymerase-3 subunit gamma/tau
MVELETLMRYIRILSELTNQIKFATGKRVLVEVALIKMTKPAMEKDLGSLIGRLTELEKKMENGVPVQQIYVPDSQNNMATEQPAPKKILEPAVTEEIQEAVNSWDKIISKLNPFIKHSIREGKLTVTKDNKLSIVFTEPINYDAVNRPDAVIDIENAISEVIGKAVKTDIRLLNQGENFQDHFVEIRKKIMIEEIEEEDF